MLRAAPAGYCHIIETWKILMRKETAMSIKDTGEFFINVKYKTFNKKKKPGEKSLGSRAMQRDLILDSKNTIHKRKNSPSPKFKPFVP